MRRIVLGVGWFFILWFGAHVIGGGIAGAIAGTSAANESEGYQLGQAAGQTFSQTYGGAIVLVAIGVSAMGTFMGWLPGTKSDRPRSAQPRAAA